MARTATRPIAVAKRAAGTIRVSLIRVCDAVFGASSLRMLTISRSTGISYLQESITGKGDQVEGTGAQGSQGNTINTAIDEAHPEKISEFLRDQNKSVTKAEFK